MKNIIVIGNKDLKIKDVIDVAYSNKHVKLLDDENYKVKIDKGAQFLSDLLREDGEIYGVTTGYGDSCTTSISRELVDELPLHLTRFHGCGMGDILSPEMARAVIITRLNSLAVGVSGVRYVLLERLVEFLEHGITPLIPEEGSVGASGDLTPLSYVAALVIGERDAHYKGEISPSLDILKKTSLEPLNLKPKEGLALMNGTAVMTAMACVAVERAKYLTKLCTRLTSMSVVALNGNHFHFDKKLFEAKPHPGQMQIARWIRSDLLSEEPPRNSKRLQDQYSLRCAPHVIGVFLDSLPWIETMVETELNSANDNPIIDAEGEHVLHGGHFYGGHIALVMDTMKNIVANFADLMDRQMALLVDTKFNRGLPANLTGSTGDRMAINHGFKAVQIGLSAWTAEALKLTMPASVFSRSTECHNQDKVSMGTIAARDCLRVLELTEQVASGLLLAVNQAYELRKRDGNLDTNHLSDDLIKFQKAISDDFEFLNEDRPLEKALREHLDAIQKQKWDLY